MFDRKIYVLLLCCFFWMSACTSTPHNPWYTSTKQLIESQRYQKAIDRIASNTPIDEVLLLKVKKLADIQRKKQVGKIRLLIKQKRWGKARETLNQLHSNQPYLASFISLKLLLDKTQFEEERVINTKRALLDADLLDLQFIQQDLSNRIHDNKIGDFPKRNRLIKQKHQLAEKLLVLSTQALVVKDYKNAQKAYEKAIEFNRQLDTGKITQAINTGLSQQNNKAINERQNSLIKQLYLAISTLDFEYLIKVQNILSHEPFHGLEVKRVLNKAKKTRLEHSLRLDEIASQQYRKGDISFAVIQWQQALKLTPKEIRIQEKLIRAKKVQRKLEKLTANKMDN